MKLFGPRIAAVPVIFAGFKLPSAMFALLTLLAANIEFVTPPGAMLRNTFPLVPPPVRPAPVAMPVIVPAPGNVCPLANVIAPAMAPPVRRK